MDKQAEAALRRAIGMLEAILSRQIVLHREMIEVAKAKRESIIKGDVAALEKSVADEKRLVARIEDEEKKRLAVTPLIKTGVGLGDESEKLSELIERMPEPERARMTAIREELRQVLETCQFENRRNAELLKTSLQHIESFLRTLAEAAAPDANYDKKGKRSGGGPSIIDRNA